MSEQIPLMGAGGALDWQNNGYRTTATAVGELVDNSIQATADQVEIILIQQQANARYKNVTDIYVVDNGGGMNQDLFQVALQFGGGHRFGAKKGLGRYGMGLPNSSVSQTKRFEVYTWQKKGPEKKLLFNYTDLDEIAEKLNPYLNPVQLMDEMDPAAAEFSNYDSKDSGTIVKWVNVNQVRPKTAKSLSDHLNRLLGKMFRYYIVGDGVSKVNISIKVFDYNGEDYSEDMSLRISSVKPYDPLFLMANTQLADHIDDSYTTPTSIETESASLKVTETLKDGKTKDHEVTIRFSHVDPEIRAKHGRNAGHTSFGEEYLHRNEKGGSAYSNISIVRAKREIISGRFGFITDISDQTNRWWSVEVQTESISDEIFGIDNRKQSADNFRFVDSEEEEIFDDEDFSQSFIRQISEKIAENIKMLRKKIKAGTPTDAVHPDDKGKNPDVGPIGDDVIIDVPGTNDDADITDDTSITDETKQEAREWLLLRYPNYADNAEQLDDAINWFLSLPAKHYIIYSDLGDIELYGYNTYGDKTIIEINSNHSFYDKLISEMEGADDQQAKLVLRFLFSSLVKAEKRFQGQSKIMRKFRAELATQLDWLIETHVDYNN